MKKTIYLIAIFCLFSCKENKVDEDYKFDSYSNSLPALETSVDSSGSKYLEKIQAHKDSFPSAFDILNKKIVAKTGKDICTILDEIYYQIHLNDGIIKRKYNNTWSPQSTDELSELNRLSIKNLTKKNKITLDEYIEMNSLAIDVCPYKY